MTTTRTLPAAFRRRAFPLALSLSKGGRRNHAPQYYLEH